VKVEKNEKMIAKYEGLVGRLVAKMTLSQTPVPGFIVGLSGTDSILSFLMLYDASERMGLADRVLGVHYVSGHRRMPTWFEREIVDWLRARCPKATVLVEEPLGGNTDQQRWADLHLRALSEVPTPQRPFPPALPEGRNYWVAGCTNATEHELGKYSMMSREVSVQPVRNVWKSDIMAMCEALDVPEIAMVHARMPDCLCGRDELAAENIETIDEILTFRIKLKGQDLDKLELLMSYVRDLKRANGFKNRTPYLI
jgi:hypothetical protein